MTTDEKRERSFDNVLAELRACHMHGAYLVMMAQAASARDLRAMHEELMPDDCRLSREDYLVFEAEWQRRRGDAPTATAAPLGDNVRQQLIIAARDHVVLVPRTWERGNETVVYHDPVVKRANLIEYYVRLLSANRETSCSPQETGNIRDPGKEFSPNALWAIAFRVGLSTDFIAMFDGKCFEVGLYSASYTNGIEVCITIPKHNITEPMTHTLLSRLATFRIGRVFRMNPKEENDFLLITFNVGGEALKSLLPDNGNADHSTATPEFVQALNECLKDAGITIAAQSSFKAAS